MTNLKMVYSQVPPELLVKAEIIGGKPRFVQPKTLVIPIPKPGQVSEGHFEIRITNENKLKIKATIETEWVNPPVRARPGPQPVQIITDVFNVSGMTEDHVGAASVNLPIFNVLDNAKPGRYGIRLYLLILEMDGIFGPFKPIPIDPYVVLTDWWPMFQHDSRHTGYTDMEVPPPLDVKWTFDAGERLLNLVAAEGLVYVFSDSKLYAINASDGSLQWTSADVWGGGPPAVVNGAVYAGGWAHKFVALDAHNGSVIWTYPTGGPVVSAPVVVDNIVYFGSDDGYIYALTADKGSLIWKYYAAPGGAIRMSPAVANGIVYASVILPGPVGKLYALNATNGNSIWNYTSTLAPKNTGLTSVSVSDGMVYVGEGFTYGPPPASSTILAINASTGNVIWASHIADTPLWSPPAVAKGQVYASSWRYDSKIYAFDANSGVLQWTFQRKSGSYLESIAVSGDIVYFGEEFDYEPNQAKLYAVNAINGSLLWTFDVGSGIRGPAIADNTVYISTEIRRLYALTPVAVHDVAITDVTPSKTVVGQGYNVSISVIVENRGDYTETFNITAYANTTLLATLTNVTLTSGDSTIIAFTWNTTGFAKGNYTISAYATPVLGETETADNTYTYVTIKIVIPGDVNCDGKVNIIDIYSIARAFGSYVGHPRYDPNYDINCDGQINIIDLYIGAKNFGKTDC